MGSNRYTGLRLCTGVGFSFLHPTEWRRAGWADGRPGVLLLPDDRDPSTLFAVETSELPEPLHPDDLPLAVEELEAVISGLDHSAIDGFDTSTAGSLRAISAKFTFAEEGVIRRRWVRILAQHTRRLTVTAQGSSPDAYQRWEPQLFTTMMSVRVHSGDQPPDPAALL